LLLAYDTESGKRVGSSRSAATPTTSFRQHAKAALRRMRRGKVDVIRQRDPDHYEMGDRVSTAPGARTGLFVPGRSTLFVAAPAHAGVSAEIRVYRIQ
jgi:hypothetical protein